ncbi:hypothetical protein [Halalkalibacter hemicellulosilyticus]|uniref:Uncharacterized protein n=1 Tax=Halalkalibacter hemicellulosilyticusJCM 9152 TaxID=1236971 RepID=W4QD86_9BACI|nr:hypothetical protein [Halalkalibacter hemicellulosilyticus]GAE29648.1 hypothetical protein JCM9152_1020 [Halalkalibacter hemicellulosilyticusJCM 9152]
MTWYSYLFMSLPETFVLLVVSFVLFGLPIKEKTKSILLFAVIQGVIVFISSLYMQNSLKPFLTFLSFYLLVWLIFRYHPLISLVITLTSFLFLVVFEVTLTFAFIQFFPISYEELFADPWIRIVTSFAMVQIPILLIAWILHKFHWTIRLPAFVRQ